MQDFYSPIQALDFVLSQTIQKKKSPENITVVGPPYIGKTKLLEHLVETANQSNSTYYAAAFINFHYATPETDQEFHTNVASAVYHVLQDRKHWYVGNALPEPTDARSSLSDIFEALQLDAQKILMVWDGLDKVLENPDITQNLWDFYRTIATKPSCTLVTGSREELQDLLENPQAVASEFWNVFADPTVNLGSFRKEELVAESPKYGFGPCYQQFYELSREVRGRIYEWTGGHPQLIQLLCQSFDGRDINEDDLHSEGKRIVSTGASKYLKYFWRELDPEVKSAIYELAQEQTPTRKVPTRIEKYALQRGFIRKSSRDSTVLCQFMLEMARSQEEHTSHLGPQFETFTDYEQQMPDVLDHLLDVIPGGDEELRKRVKGCLSQATVSAEDALYDIRKVSNRALELVLEAETDEGNKFPDKWIETWKTYADDEQGNAREVEACMRLSSVPRGAGMRLTVLRNIVSGNKGRIPYLAKHVTRMSSGLLSYLHEAGNLGQHWRDYPDLKITPSYVTTICFIAIQLFAQLAEQLPPDNA